MSGSFWRSSMLFGDVRWKDDVGGIETAVTLTDVLMPVAEVLAAEGEGLATGSVGADVTAVFGGHGVSWWGSPPGVFDISFSVQNIHSAGVSGGIYGQNMSAKGLSGKIWKRQKLATSF